MIELDVDLHLRLPKANAATLKTLPSEYDARITENGETLDVRIQYASGKPLRAGQDISQPISEFVDGLQPILGALGVNKGLLRIGIYYDTSKQVTLSTELSGLCLQKLAALGLAIHTTAYPSSD